MIAAKIQGFREEIRRRQISRQFKKCRERIARTHFPQVFNEGSRNLIEQFETETSELSIALNQTDLFRVLEALQSLRKLCKDIPHETKVVLAHKQYQVIEHISHSLKVTEEVTRTDTDAHRITPIVHNCFCIMEEFVWSSEITEQRIVESQFLEITAKFLFKNTPYKKATLVALTSVLANCVRQNLKLAELLFNLNIHRFLIHAIQEIDVPLQDVLVGRFFFFLRSFLSEFQKAPQLTTKEIEACYSGTRSALDVYAAQGYDSEQNVEAIEDCLFILKIMIDLGMIHYNRPDLNLPELTDFIAQKNCPLAIKQQALLLLDICIFKDEEDLTEYLVLNCGLLPKIWGSCEELKYIIMNIVANIALCPLLKKEIAPLLSSIRLLLYYQNDMVQIYTFLLNYFDCQGYEINDMLEENLVQELHKTESDNIKIMKIQIGIWIGLIMKGYQRPPPHRLLGNEELQEADQLRACWRHYQGEVQI